MKCLKNMTFWGFLFILDAEYHWKYANKKEQQKIKKSYRRSKTLIKIGKRMIKYNVIKREFSVSIHGYVLVYFPTRIKL